MNIQDFRERSVWAREARVEGERKGLREAVRTACELLSIELTDEREARLSSLDLEGLEALLASIRKHRAWPDPAP